MPWPVVSAGLLRVVAAHRCSAHGQVQHEALVKPSMRPLPALCHQVRESAMRPAGVGVKIVPAQRLEGRFL